MKIYSNIHACLSVPDKSISEILRIILMPSLTKNNNTMNPENLRLYTFDKISNTPTEKCIEHA